MMDWVELFLVVHAFISSIIGMLLYARLKMTQDALNELALYFLFCGEKDTQQAIDEILHDVEEW